MGKIRFRPDIEGLRAVAVLLVILNHLDVPGAYGGYAGVDIFFVISGFLITSLLAAEYAQKAQDRRGYGSISIGRFYVRRAKRIVPAALVVLVFTLVGARILLNALRVDQVESDAVWAALFGSNINFIHQGADYFAQDLNTSPFQHYWSLAVEEQFYLVWPALFLLATTWHHMKVFGRVFSWRWRVGIAAGVIGSASLVWSVLATRSDPAGAYFSPLTRGWELALGALIGIVATRTTVLPRTTAMVISAAGALLLVLSFVLIDAETAFPGYAALLPTVAAGLLIIGGLTEQGWSPIPNRLLSLRPFRFVGRISYSLYLWHWPLIIFAIALYPNATDDWIIRASIGAITVLVATASFYLIEQPGRRINFNIERLPGKRRRWEDILFAACAATAAIAIVGVTITASKGSPKPAPEAIHNTGYAFEQPIPGVTGTATGTQLTSADQSVDAQPVNASEASRSYSRLLATWQTKIEQGLTVTTLPSSLRPLSSHLTIASDDKCMSYRLHIVDHQDECRRGNPSSAHVAVITGDSHAGMWVAALAGALGTNWSLRPFTRAWCGWSGGSENIAAEDRPRNRDCSDLQAQTIAQIRAIHPDLVVLSESGVRPDAAMQTAIRTLKPLTQHVVVLGHTPEMPNFVNCLSGDTNIAACFGSVSETDRDDVRREKNAAALADTPFMDTTPWLCLGSRCPAVIDDTPVFADGSHLSTQMAESLVPLLRSALKQAGVPS